MDNRIALIGIIVENEESVEKLNNILLTYRKFVIGRLGIPYPKREIGIISVALDAPNDIISAVSGKLGALPGVSTKTTYSNIQKEGK